MTALQSMKAFNDEGLSVVIRWNNIYREYTVKPRWNFRSSDSDYKTTDISDAIDTAREIDLNTHDCAYKTGGRL